MKIQPQGVMVRRLLALYRASSPATRAAGIGWYETAGNAAATMWPERPDIAAGVIAALSPRAHWVTNLRWAAAIIHAARTGQECPQVGMTDGRNKAWRIANGEPWQDVLRGPKVTRFAASIDPTVRDMSRATVDVWMVRAAEGVNGPKSSKGIPLAPARARYVAIERAIQRAAQLAGGISAAEFQAIVWLQISGNEVNV